MKPLLVIGLLMGATAVCSANITMVIDTDFGAFWFIGSGEVFVTEGDVKNALYEFTESEGYTADNDITFASSEAFSSSLGSLESAIPSRWIVSNDFTPQLRLGGTVSGQQIFTGSGTPFPYSDLFGDLATGGEEVFEAGRAYMTTLLNTGGYFDGGPGVDPILVTSVNAVPEPSVTALVVFSAAALVLCTRHRRRVRL